MKFSYQYLKYPTSRQALLWFFKRSQQTVKQISEKQKVSVATVSRTLKQANSRIDILLSNAAKMNKIHLSLLNSEYGYARGKSCIFGVETHITYSPTNGINVWYEHEGKCEDCEDFTSCRKSILKEYEERNIKTPNDVIRPTILSDILFKRIEKMIKI